MIITELFYQTKYILNLLFTIFAIPIILRNIFKIGVSGVTLTNDNQILIIKRSTKVSLLYFFYYDHHFKRD